MNSYALHCRTVAAMLALVVSTLVGLDCAAAWKAEENVETPSYAVTQPVSSNLNIDTVALMCEAANDATVLQIKVYLTDDGPLRPYGVTVEQLKASPRAEIWIDERIFPVGVLFADEFVVLGNGEYERFPLLSGDLLDAMASGDRMVLRFDLVAEPPGQAAAFDGEAVFELGSAAISVVGRCARRPTDFRPGLAGS